MLNNDESNYRSVHPDLESANAGGVTIASEQAPDVLEWWEAGLLLLAIGVSYIVFGVVLAMFIPTRWVALIVEILVFFLPVLILIHVSRLRRSGILVYRPIITFRLAVMIMAVSASYSVATSILVELAHAVWPIPEMMLRMMVDLMHTNSIPEFAGVVFVVAVTPAIAEELLFRGILQPALIRRIGPSAGIVVTAFIFSFFHLNPWIFLPLFIVGTFLGYVAYKTGTFWASAFAHFGTNLLAIIEMNRAQATDYATMTESGPWYIFVSGTIVAIVGTVVLKNLITRAALLKADE